MTVMYTADQIAEQIQICFDRGALPAFKCFIASHHSRSTWVLSSDYVWANTQRPHNTIVFTLYPDVSLPELQHVFPKDFKDTRKIAPEAIRWFRRSDHFHFCFVSDKNDSIFHSGGSDRGRIARESIAKTLNFLKNANAPSWIIELYRGFEQKSRSSSFNVRLFGDVLLLTTCYSFIVGLLAREQRLERLLWCSDRDEKTTWNNRLVYFLALVNAARRANEWKVRLDADNLPFLILAQDTSARKFDPVIRPPDFLAGALSAWDLDQSSTEEAAEKYGTILRDAMADNSNMFVVHLQLSQKHLWARRVAINRVAVL